MIDADAMSVHLNFLQEAVQPEGDINAEGCLEDIKTLSRELSVPLIVKETGNGISRSTAKKLADAEVDLLDIAGKGGTTWPGVEAKRAREKGEKTKEKLGKLYSDWGIPTVVSIVETCSEHPKIVASGGIRSGLDIAKSISLGADFAGLAKPMLNPAVQGKKETKNTVEQIVEELRTAMFITGSKDVEELSKVEAVVTGKTIDYLTQLQQSK